MRSNTSPKKTKKPYISLIHKVFYSTLLLLSKKPGAENGTRTRDLNLGKVALYQLSYSRIRPAKDLNFTQFFGIGKSTLPKKTKNTINTVFEDPFSGVFRRFEAEERL